VTDVTTTAAGPGAAVEVATWQPVEVVDVDGWRAGFSAGFTRRANSVLPRSEPGDVGAALDTVERLYAARGLPARFRVCSSARPVGLDARLAARGYLVAATTHVLVRDVQDAGVQAPAQRAGAGGTDAGRAAIAVADEPDDDWLAGWLDVKAAGGAVDRALAAAVVGGSPATYLTARDADGVLGVVRAGFAGEWAALSCLMVAPRARRRGLATELTGQAMRIAAERGAARAFLQVEAANGAAVALYGGLGFVHADTYHYRER
jgi:ribosomal protein S18 acetylase RimI-like enzyme